MSNEKGFQLEWTNMLGIWKAKVDMYTLQTSYF